MNTIYKVNNNIKYDVNSNIEKNVNKKLNNSFFQAYEEKLNENVKFSKHAISRIKSRNLNIDYNKIEKAIDKAKNKGINNAMIILDDNVVIASVKNRTIITMANQKDLDEKIVTNIDGAIFA